MRFLHHSQIIFHFISFSFTLYCVCVYLLHIHYNITHPCLSLFTIYKYISLTTWLMQMSVNSFNSLSLFYLTFFISLKKIIVWRMKKWKKYLKVQKKLLNFYSFSNIALTLTIWSHLTILVDWWHSFLISHAIDIWWRWEWGCGTAAATAWISACVTCIIAKTWTKYLTTLKMITF